MGCTLSKTQDEHATLPAALIDVYVFLPGLRLPRRVDFGKSLPRDHLSSSVTGRLTALRSKVVSAAESACKSKPNSKIAESNGIYELRSALNNYLSALHGMTMEGNRNLSTCFEFGWGNQEDETKETVLSNVYYDLLSVLHLLAMLSLLEANFSLTPEEHRARSNDGRKATVEMLLETARILDYCIERVYPQLSEDLRTKLPADVQEGSLKSLQMQALGQALEIQLGLAIDNLRATLAVKRRLACEGVKYWQLAVEKLQQVRLRNHWGEKHTLFLKWKSAAAKAAAYYYHGLVLDEGAQKNKSSQSGACLQAAESFLAESRTLCTEFTAAAPVTKRKPPAWGAMKSLSERIPKEAAKRTKGGNQHKDRVPETIPELPDFSLSLQWDEYELPAVDSIWS